MPSRRRSDRTLHALPLILAACALLAPTPARAAGDPGEYRVKSALICNFARFTQWPSDGAGQDAAPLRVMVLGDHEVLSAMAAIEGQMVGRRRISVSALPASNDPGGAHILFVAETERERWTKVQLAIGSAPILTIGEMNGFIESGGMINLEMSDKKIRFHVNLRQTKVAGLSLSSRVIKLASSVEETVE